MLDIQFVRENTERVKQNTEQKNIKADIDKLLEFDEERLELLKQVESIRAERNKLADSAKGKKPSQEQIDQGKKLKDELAELEGKLKGVEADFNNLLSQVPNIIPDDTPIGGEEKNREEKHWGESKATKVKDHLTWGEENDMIDFERGAKVAGNKFYFLKDSLVELELAVMQFALRLARKEGFVPMTVPHLVNTKVAEGTGFLPRGEERQIYKIEGEDLNLIATAEMPITGYHADEIIEKPKLPLLYAGISPAYRMEAGAYGKHSRGLYRVHQFNKLELYVFCEPGDSEDWHQKLVALEEKLCQEIGIPYRLVRIASGDLGAPAYKKYDIEYWSPADQEYRELMSCSNVTDYQARRLGIRYRDENGTVKYVHTLNATAAAFSRVAISIIENFQDEADKVHIPKALKELMGGRETL